MLCTLLSACSIGPRRPALPGDVQPAPSTSVEGAGRPPLDWLIGAIGNIKGATAAVYRLHDSAGHGMDTAKVIAGPDRDYIAVYHFLREGVFTTGLATSSNLKTWQYRRDLAVHASQPSVAALSDGGYLLAVEVDNRTKRGIPQRVLRFMHYADLQQLMGGYADRLYTAPHRLVGTHGGAEGTPSIESTRLHPDIDHSTVVMGLHYLRRQSDHEARGTLSNFNSWSATPDSAFDTALTRAGALGSHGDRDPVTYRNRHYSLVEGQLQPHGPWRLLLYDQEAGVAHVVPVRTAAGASSAANPTITQVMSPSGTPALVMTAYLPVPGAAAGEAGEVLYYLDLDASTRGAPLVAAAGDIACPDYQKVSATTCQQVATSDLIEAVGPDSVFALGDDQYEHGSLENFRQSYGRSWGHFLAKTYPAIGNHDYGSDGGTGYYRYFGAAAGSAEDGGYSFDLGSWHIISLNSECPVGGLSCTGVGHQLEWLKHDLAGNHSHCTLAFWHRPLFTSGREGPTLQTRPFWAALSAAGADVVLNAHDHDYERFDPQGPTGTADALEGLTEFVVGTGGKSLTGFVRVEDHSRVRLAGQFGVVRLLLLQDSLAWHFSTVQVHGAAPTVDRGTRQCH